MTPRTATVRRWSIGLALAATVAVPVGAAAVPSAAAAAHASRTTCAGVRLWTFRFHPATVTERHSTTLLVTVRNCTAARFTGTLQTSGFVCVTVDPLVRGVAVGPHASEQRNETFVVPSCTGTGRIDGRLSATGGHEVAHRVATVQVVAG